MNTLRNWIYTHSALIFFILLIATHLFVINDYGFTWDFHFHFFGGGKLLGYSWQELESRLLPYIEPDPRFAWSLPYGPLMSIPPVVSYLFFYKLLHLLPQDSAYHLPIMFWGVAGIFALYGLLKEAINTRVALVAAFFVSVMPRFFSDMHNNMKDVPSAAIFAINIWLLYRLVKHKRLSDLFWAVIGFAVAFNVKINSIFIPIVFATWLLIRNHLNPKHEILKNSKKNKNVQVSKFQHLNLFRISILELIYFIAAPITAFLLWWFFWPNPIAQLEHAYRTFAIGTNNIEVLLQGNWYCSGKNVPWYYPFWYLAITTPLPILFFFLIGLIKLRTSNYELRTLLLLWFFLPLTRYFFPHIGVIDGIRHFEEVLFPLAAIAAIGFDKIFSFVWLSHTKLVFVVLTIFYLLFTNYSHHPFQITYFNELVGGTNGAVGKYDLDYWGGSQKQAVKWINDHAPENSKVHIVMAADVAGRYLRSDLLPNLNKFGYDDSDYVIFLHRQSFFYRFFYAYEYLLSHKPTYSIYVNNTPLVWIFDNRTDNKTPRQTPWWKGEDPCIIKYW